METVPQAACVVYSPSEKLTTEPQAIDKQPFSGGKQRRILNRLGRPLKSADKFPSGIRRMIERALVSAGGVDYLTRQAKQNPAAFMGLLGKVMPKEVNLNANGSLRLTMFLSTEKPPIDVPRETIEG
jgi:hypothetical protein